MKVDSSFTSLTVTATGKVNPVGQTDEIVIIEAQKSNSVNVNHSHLAGYGFIFSFIFSSLRSSDQKPECSGYERLTCGQALERNTGSKKKD